MSKELKKVLILAYDFPPYKSVGALRPYSWFNDFKELGLKPTVVTRQWAMRYGDSRDYVDYGISDDVIIENQTKGKVIRTPYFQSLSNKLALSRYPKVLSPFRKLLSLVGVYAQFLSLKGAQYQIYKAAKQELKTEDYDIILATGEPFSLFYYASKLSEKYSIPWVADYRDPWTSNTNRPQKGLFFRMNGFLEKRVLKSCSLVTTVSEYVVSSISDFTFGKEVEIVKNGYFSSNTGWQLPVPDDVFRVGFCGSVYNWHPLQLFLESLNKVLMKGVNFELVFVGVNVENQIKELLSREGFDELFSRTVIKPKMSNNDVQKEISKFSIGIIFNDYNILGTKIYDYLAVKCPVLLCFTDSFKAAKLKEKHFDPSLMTKAKETNNNLQEALIRYCNAGLALKDENLFVHTLTNFIDNPRQLNEFSFVHSEEFSRYGQNILMVKALKTLVI